MNSSGRLSNAWPRRSRASRPPVENAKIAVYLGVDTNLQAGFEIEDMQWTEAMQSDDAQLARRTYIAEEPDSRRHWFESQNSKNYPTHAGH